jgi:hypothetical protein
LSGRGVVVATVLILIAAFAVGPLGPAPASPPALAAECNGDECQSPPPAPEEIVPGTAVVEGPQNPPVRFPKPHKPKKHHGKKHHPKHRGKR